ncbi:hypothetical protein PVK06_040279 [Gossypium arboreum]|uniref:Uncharacterized protein n=1 Tax=Gossypium arboreum TaxID=29729 RepID=A0ABR0N546_GOSAR|nr:hypothetical protein PVK06_040279 [Gossypium arboreum]
MDLGRGKSQLVRPLLNGDDLRTAPGGLSQSNGLDVANIDCELEEEPFTNEEGRKRQRESNKLAHLIASEGIKKRETTYLMNLVSSSAEEVVVDDRRWTEVMRETRGWRTVDEDRIDF